MAARTFHATLLNTNFPFNFNELGSTLIYGTPLEQNRGVPQDFLGTTASDSFGACQAYFLQNCFPTARGYSSLKFERMIPPNPTPMVSASEVFVLRGAGTNLALLVVSDSHLNIFDPESGQWISSITSVTPDTRVSVAYVKNQTYVCIEELGIQVYNFQEKKLEPIPFQGISPVSVLGVVSGGDRLVVYSESEIAWSSVLDPTDFTPSLDTGAGSTSVLAIQGEIVTAVSMGEDIIFYTATNAVYAAKTGNLAFPYQFQEIKGSEGVASRYHVTQGTNRNVHISWTASGFQEVSQQGAEYTWPELSQGIIRGQETKVKDSYLEIVSHNEALDVRLNFVSNRWIAISTRTESQKVAGAAFTRAYIFDTLLNRWGSLDLPHYALVQFTSPDFFIPVTYDDLAEEFPIYSDMEGHLYREWRVPRRTTAPVAGKNFGVLAADSSIVRVGLYESMQNIGTARGLGAKESKVILGKFKIFRDQGSHFQWFKAQGVDGASKKVHSHDYTGNYIDTYDNFTSNPRHQGQFFKRMNADSFSLEFSGDFHLVDLAIHATDAGSRNQRFGYTLDCSCITLDWDDILYSVVLGNIEVD